MYVKRGSNEWSQYTSAKRGMFKEVLMSGHNTCYPRNTKRLNPKISDLRNPEHFDNGVLQPVSYHTVYKVRS